MKLEMNVTGLDGVLATLQSLPSELVSKRGGPVKLALAKGARVILAQAKANLQNVIAREGGESTGLLEKNLVVTRGKAPASGKGERYLVRVRRKAYPGRADSGGPITVRKSAALLEYGSSTQRATPWLRPAASAKAQEAIDVTSTDLLRRLDKLVRQLAAQNGRK